MGEPQPSIDRRPSRSRAATAVMVIALLLPYAGLCFPGLYARATPAVFGFPFFYWYQFVWVVLTSILLFAVYRILRSR